MLSRMSNSARTESGYSWHLVNGKLQFNLVQRWLDDALRVETATTLEPERWHHVVATYDGSRVASGVQLYVNGRRATLKVNLDDLNQNFQTKEPLRIGAGGAPDNHFHGDIDEVRIYERVLSPAQVEILATPEPIRAILAIPAPQRSSGQAQKLYSYFLEQHAPASIRTAYERHLQLREQRERFVDGFPTTMVMEEMPKPRDTYVLIRGAYDKHGEKVAAGVPATLPTLPSHRHNNRLGFAHWLVSPENPLTARVTVNRYWQLLFGTGLATTAEDFGIQGESGQPPELLDWLATEFMSPHRFLSPGERRQRRGVGIRRPFKRSSPAPPIANPRGWSPDLPSASGKPFAGSRPALRHTAEMIRDQALAASGLLVERLGGPSVKPYQAADSWKDWRPTAPRRSTCKTGVPACIAAALHI